MKISAFSTVVGGRVLGPPYHHQREIQRYQPRSSETERANHALASPTSWTIDGSCYKSLAHVRKTGKPEKGCEEAHEQ